MKSIKTKRNLIKSLIKGIAPDNDITVQYYRLEIYRAVNYTSIKKKKYLGSLGGSVV